MTSRKLPAIAASLILLAFASVLFFPALFQGRILAPLDIATTMLAPWNADAVGIKPKNHYPADAVTQYLPYRIFSEKSLREDGYIGWNPYEMGGVSLAENTMALPGAWPHQLHRFLPYKDAWNLGIFVEFLTAGAGMLVFLRSRKLPWIPCLIGALAYMANTQFVIWIYHRWALGSFCWMPWVLWSAVDGLNWRKPGIRQLLLPIFLAMALMGGTLQHTAFVVIACACLFIGSIRDLRKPLSSFPSAACWTIAFVIAACIASFTLIPQFSGYFANIQIGHTRGGIGYEKGILQPVYQAFLIPAQIWPWLLGDPSTIDGFRLMKCGFMDIAYLGTVPMILALVGVFRRQLPNQAKWLILAGLLIPLTPLVGPLYHRVQLLFLLGGAWMCAEVLADLGRFPSKYLSRVLPAAVALIGAILITGSILPNGVRKSLEDKVVSQSLKATANSSLAEDKAWIEARARRWTDRLDILHPRTAWTYSLLVCGTLGLAAIGRGSAKVSRIGTPMILAATSLELLTFFLGWTTFSDPSELQPSHPAIERTRSLAGPHRVLQQADGAGFTDIFTSPNLLAAYLIPSVDAYESIQYPSTSHVLAKAAANDRLNLAGVGISVQPADLAPTAGTSTWQIEETISGYVIRRNPFVPAPVLAGFGPLPNDVSEIANIMASAVPINPGFHTMNRLQFEKPAGSTWIRIAQNWHPGWQWKTKDGKWKRATCGPDAATWIDTDSKIAALIEARFVPRPAWTCCLSLITMAFWVVLVSIFAWRKRNGMRESSNLSSN